MEKSSTDLYQLDNLIKIMKSVERMGKLKSGYYSEKVMTLSVELRNLRRVTKKKAKDKRADDLLKIEEIREEMTMLKETLLKEKSSEIGSGKARYSIRQKEIRGHGAFVAGDINALVISQIIKQELRRSYRLYPANMDMIIEQVKALLDNPMPKVIIRADIQHFFESIPQKPLIQKLTDDGYISRRTLKYLKGMLFRCNEMQENTEELGVPRGLAFSSYLAELYMMPIDATIRKLDGVYYYKRYVDDIILIADPSKLTDKEYWERLCGILRTKSLMLHENSEKKYLAVFDKNTEEEGFDYLGYHFSYSKGKLEIGMSEKRLNKYLTLINAVFEIYGQCASYRTGKDKGAGERKMRKDALHQLFARLKTLTTNGFLSGRKNYVPTGIFYSNKFLTDLTQLKWLDRHLSATIDDSKSFCPPMNLFNYGDGNGYDENLEQIKRRLHEFSFEAGFRERKIYKREHFNRTMLDLQRIYYFKSHE